MPVDTPARQYDEMASKWQRCRDTYDGSDAVKARGREYLPELGVHRQEAKAYAAYKKRAMFYNAMARTVDGLAGMVHQKEPEIEVPSAIEDHLEDITLTGVPLPLFGLDVTTEVLITGRAGVLVDMADDDSSDNRPYMVLYRAEDIVSWRVERFGGEQILTRVVLCETAEEPDDKDPFKSEQVKQYRVLELVEGQYTQTLWRENTRESGEFEPWSPDGDDPKVVPLRRGDRFDFIPFVFVGPTSIEPSVQKPPLLDLADVVLSHYRSMADLEHGRHWTALPVPWFASEKTPDGPLFFGSAEALDLGEGGQAGMLEFTGQGLGALENADEQKRKLMAVLGARLLEEQPSTPETATAVGFRHSGEHATLRTIAGSISQALTVALQWHGWWQGIESDPEDVEAAAQLNTDFVNIRLSAEEVRAAVMAYQSGGISFETLFWNLQQGEWAMPERTVEDERAAVVREGGMALGGDLSMGED